MNIGTARWMEFNLMAGGAIPAKVRSLSGARVYTKWRDLSHVAWVCVCAARKLILISLRFDSRALVCLCRTWLSEPLSISFAEKPRRSSGPAGYPRVRRGGGGGCSKVRLPLLKLSPSYPLLPSEIKASGGGGVGRDSFLSLVPSLSLFSHTLSSFLSHFTFRFT